MFLSLSFSLKNKLKKNKPTVMSMQKFILLLLFFKIYFRREGRKKERERNIYVQVMYRLRTPNWGPGPQPRHVH